MVNNFRCKNLEERVDKLIRLRQTQVYGKIFVYGFHFLKGEYKLIETWPTNK